MIYPYNNIWPNIHSTAYILPSADVIGAVEIGQLSSIWFQSVVRGDVNKIVIGDRTNIQDMCMLHVRKEYELYIGHDVTLGHRVSLHGCYISDRVLIGIGATVLDCAKVGSDCIIGANSLLTEEKHFESGSMIFGSPAKVVRKLTQTELAFLKISASNYVSYAKQYMTSIRSATQYMHVNSADYLEEV